MTTINSATISAANVLVLTDELAAIRDYLAEQGQADMAIVIDAIIAKRAIRSAKDSARRAEKSASKAEAVRATAEAIAEKLPAEEVVTNKVIRALVGKDNINYATRVIHALVEMGKLTEIVPPKGYSSKCYQVAA